MAQKIYKLFLGKPTEAWYQLSKEEQGNLLAKLHEALQQAGGKRLVLCDSSWASERWEFFGVEEFSDIEAEQKHTELLKEINWFRYVETISVLGTEWPSS